MKVQFKPTETHEAIQWTGENKDEVFEFIKRVFRSVMVGTMGEAIIFQYYWEVTNSNAQYVLSKMDYLVSNNPVPYNEGSFNDTFNVMEGE